nr:MAG TPA: hypothetical protein [Caudoviricetes sp.]
MSKRIKMPCGQNKRSREDMRKIVTHIDGGGRMTKKEVDEVIMAANEVVKNIGSIDEIDEMIERIETYSLIEGISFTTNINVWQAGRTVAQERINLNSFLSSDDQVLIRKAIIVALKKKRKELTSDFKEVTGKFEKLTKLAKEVLNE